MQRDFLSSIRLIKNALHTAGKHSSMPGYRKDFGMFQGLRLLGAGKTRLIKL